MAKETPSDLHARIERWFQDTIRFGAIAQDTAAYNQASAAKDKLYDVLADYLGASAAVDPPQPPEDSTPFAKA